MSAARGNSRSPMRSRCAWGAATSMRALVASCWRQRRWCARAPRRLVTSICAMAMALRSGGRADTRPAPSRWPGQEITPILMAKKKSDRDVIVGLDIGTSKVLALVGEITPEGAIEIIGMGSQPSRGLKKGVVVNIESTVQSIQRAVEEAELMADCEINAVYAGIAGSHVRSLNSHGVVAIRDREVTGVDVEQVIEAAKAVAIPADQRILHVLPQEFVIDGQEGIRDP